MKRLNGFSLMEMMIVLAIVAIVAAASAPMVNKKMVRAASEKSPWIFTSGESIAYNLDNPDGIQDNKTARIGTGIDNPGGVHPRLYITTNNDATPHIMFGRNDNGNLMRLIAGGAANNIWFSSFANLSTTSGGVVVGPDARARASFPVVIGYSANSTASDNGQLPAATVTIGRGALSTKIAAVTIGQFAKTRANEGVAIGNGAQSGTVGGVDRYAAIAIGSAALSNNIRSIAIGRHAEATGVGSISMGSSGDDGQENRARAQGASSIAIGQSALAQNNNSIAIGGSAQATGQTSIAINGNAPSNNSISIGWGANAASNNSLAFGYNAKTGSGNVSGNQNGGKQLALGYGANATYYESVALGANCAASNYRSTAIGSESKAYGTSSLALGRAAQTTVSANDAIAIGTGAKASHFHSIALGWNAQTPAANTIVLGDSDSNVYIPGNLVVGKVTFLGKDLGTSDFPGSGRRSALFMRFSTDSGKMRRIYEGEHSDDKLYSHDSDSSGLMPFTSDRRLKNVGKEFTSGLDKIKKLEVFNYTFKDDKDKTPRVGVMAQDLQKIFPDAVIKGEDGFLRIRMEDMFYAVINAIKELDNRTSLQEKKIKELEKRIEELEKRL